MSFMSIEEKQPRPRGEMTGGIPNLRTEVKHPRSRGENAVEPTGIAPAVETSPLTRGKRYKVYYGGRGCRNIPAHAGKTARISDTDDYVKETSPLTRGKPQGNGTLTVNIRNIPAHAGKTLSSQRALRKQEKHPRSRGENHKLFCLGSSVRETSPLTRGKPAYG